MLNAAEMNSETRQIAKRRLSFCILDSLDKVDQITFLAQQAHFESRFSYITFAPHKVRRIAEQALDDPKRRAVLLCHDAEKPVGFVYCSIGEYHIGTGSLITTIHNINVLSDFRETLNGGRASLGLLRGVDRWSRARGSSEILFHVTSGVDLARTHKFIKRLGYSFIGGSYAKQLD